jgi:hypothetical protein
MTFNKTRTVILNRPTRPSGFISQQSVLYAEVNGTKQHAPFCRETEYQGQSNTARDTGSKHSNCNSFISFNNAVSTENSAEYENRMMTSARGSGQVLFYGIVCDRNRTAPSSYWPLYYNILLNQTVI